MAESIFLRVRRVLSGSVEDAVDGLERQGGAGVMREALREVDRAMDEARSTKQAATARRLLAERQRRMIAEQNDKLTEKARFALAEDREDLAEMAVQRQLSLEAESARLEEVVAEAAVEEGKLDECLAALEARQTRMREDLEAFELAQRDAASAGGKPCAAVGGGVEKRMENAEAAFDRAMDGAGGTTVRSDGESLRSIAEIDTMQRSATVKERLDALKARAA